MPVQYLLPCECGKKIAVDSTQSGLTVECVCGQSLKVPTHRGLQALERAEPEPDLKKRTTDSAAATTWSLRQGALVLGLMLAILGGIGWGITIATWPKDEIEELIAEGGVPMAMNAWASLKQGYDVTQNEYMADFRVQLQRHFYIQRISMVVTAVGLIVTVVSLFLPGRAAAKK